MRFLPLVALLACSDPVVPVSGAPVIYSNGMAEVVRIDDAERGISCYVLTGAYKAAMWCYLR